MADSLSWYDSDDLWRDIYPVLFGKERWERTAQGVDLLLSLVPIPSGGRVLDLCCGPGRHSLELARRGFRPTGVDRTASYIEEARERAEAEGLQIELVLEDMRRFRRASSFDAALNLFTSFGYFEDPADDARVVENLEASLVPGGVLVMDLMSKEICARIFRERDWSWIDSAQRTRMLEERSVSPDWGMMQNTWTLIGPAGEREIRFSHRLYAGTELAALLERAGFADVRLYGSLGGTPYDHQAQRLIVVARKPAQGAAGGRISGAG
jgi:SAM-dependent methyltransferase